MACKRSELEADYARTLLPLARMWRQAADRALDGMGVSAASGWALVQVSRLGADVRQTDLARELDITGASLVRLLDQMAAADLVERVRDTVDARVSRVRMTDAGRRLAASIEDALSTLRHDMLAGISDAELAAALRVAETLATSFMRRRPS
jgi:MarR family transcriptional regulator for hemolysin